MPLYISTPPHFREKHCSLCSIAFISQLQLNMHDTVMCVTVPGPSSPLLLCNSLYGCSKHTVLIDDPNECNSCCKDSTSMCTTSCLLWGITRLFIQWCLRGGSVRSHLENEELLFISNGINNSTKSLTTWPREIWQTRKNNLEKKMLNQGFCSLFHCGSVRPPQLSWR